MTILDVLKLRANQQADRDAYIFLKSGVAVDRKVTFKQLYKNSQKIYNFIACRKTKKELVIILADNSPEFLYAFFGTLLSRKIPVVINPLQKNLQDRLNSIINDSGASLCLASQQYFLRHQDGFLKNSIECLNINLILDCDDEMEISEDIYHKDDIAFIQYTSGSTSKPKGIIVTHQNLMENSELIKERYQHNCDSVGLSWMPIYHDLGLVGGIIQPLYCGFKEYILPHLTFIKRPISWLEAISEFRVNTTGGPNFAFDLCINLLDSNKQYSFDLSSWSIALIGADKIHRSTIENFSQTFKAFGFNETAFFPCYGLAEATLFVSSVDKFNKPRFKNISVSNEGGAAFYIDSDDVVSCGKPVIDVDIVDDCGESVAVNHIGEIQISGSSVSPGYWKKDYLFDNSGIPTVPVSRYKTGDLGLIDKFGELFILGRIKELIIINGVNVYPHDIENSIDRNLEPIRGQRSSAFSIDGSNIILFQEIAKTYNKDHDVISDIESKIHHSVFEKCGVTIDKIIFMSSRKIPVTSSGKVQRLLCKNLYPDKLIGVLDYSKDCLT